MTHKEIVQRIIGPIQPMGDAAFDGARLENLKIMCELVEELISDISTVAGYRTSRLHSEKEAGEYASKFIKQTIGEYTI